MTITRIIEGEFFLFILAAVAVSSYMVWQKNHQVQLATPIVMDTTQKSVTPDFNTQVVKTEAIDTISQPSPDGTRQITMKTTHNRNGTLKYEFFTSDSSGSNLNSIYTATESATEIMSIPFNAWSPNDNYVFIQKDNDALVFQANSEDITPGTKYLDVRELFNTPGRTALYQETLGWASPTLLIVNSVTPKNEKGSSYWFEVPSKAIIQLASQF